MRSRPSAAIETAQGELRRQLLRELRILAGANLLAFALALITLQRRQHLAAAAAGRAVIGAATLTAAGHLFNDHLQALRRLG